MTSAEMESTLDKLIAITEKMMYELEPLAKATREKLNPQYQHEVVDRVDEVAADVRQLRQSFDKIRGTSDSAPVRTGFQTEVKP